MTKSLITVREASQHSGWSESRIYKFIEHRTLGAYKPTGGRVFIELSELEALMRTNRRHNREELMEMAVNHKRAS